jgi:hypothetical protein
MKPFHRGRKAAERGGRTITLDASAARTEAVKDKDVSHRTEERGWAQSAKEFIQMMIGGYARVVVLAS